MLMLQNMATLLFNMAAAAQGALPGAVLNFSPGGVFYAFHQSVASVMLWLQWQLVLLWLKIRAATATGSDLDTWMADFGVVREPATFASGSITAVRFTATAAASIPVGATVITADLAQTFAITEDATNPYWVASGSYLIPAGVSSATLPVVATVAGTGGNVSAGAIALLGSALAGIDTVTNAAAFVNGAEAEGDAALRARFVIFVNTRAQATPGAVVAAIIGVQTGLTYSLFENVASNGVAQPGNFVVVVDDGSGTPAASLLANVNAAIVPVRPINSTWATVGPVVSPAAVVANINPPSGSSKAALAPAIQTAVTAYIDALPVNNVAQGTTTAATLFAAQLVAVVASACPTGTTVTSVTVNGGSANIVPANMGVARCSGVTVP